MEFICVTWLTSHKLISPLNEVAVEALCADRHQHRPQWQQRRMWLRLMYFLMRELDNYVDK